MPFSSPPWTEIGNLQSEINSLKSQLSQKADSHEIHTINSTMDGLECSIREFSSTLDGLRSEIETLQEKIINMEENPIHKCESPELLAQIKTLKEHHASCSWSEK